MIYKNTCWFIKILGCLFKHFASLQNHHLQVFRSPKSAFSDDEMQLWILLRLIKQPPVHYYWATQQAKGRAVDGPKSPVLIQVRMLYYLTLTELTLDELLPSSHFKNYPCETKTSKAAFLQKWQYYNKRNKTKKKKSSVLVILLTLTQSV